MLCQFFFFCKLSQGHNTSFVRLTECVVKGVGDRFVPLTLEEGQACRRHVVLVLSVEIQRLERAILQRMAVDERQRRLSGFCSHLSQQPR